MFVFIPLGLVHSPRVCPSVVNTIFFTIFRSGLMLAPEMIASRRKTHFFIFRSDFEKFP